MIADGNEIGRDEMARSGFGGLVENVPVRITSPRCLIVWHFLLHFNVIVTYSS